MPDLATFGVVLLHWAVPVVLAICLHEAAHGYVAWILGDDTAKRLGRVSINPLRHVHLFGTIILPLMLFLMRAPFLFGFAKPVPVNFSRLRRPRRDMVWVALAGPAINVFLAIFSAIFLHSVAFLDAPYAGIIEANLTNSVIVNLALAVFNMFPLPPLDGGRIVTGILPLKWAIPYARLERYGLLILVGILLLPYLGEKLGMNLDIIGGFIGYGVSFLLKFVLAFAGVFA